MILPVMKASHLILVLFAACRGQPEGGAPSEGGTALTGDAGGPPGTDGTTAAGPSDGTATEGMPTGEGGGTTDGGMGDYGDPPNDGEGGDPYDRPGDGDGGTCGMPSLIDRDGGGTANKRSDCSKQSDNPMDWRACAQQISGASSGKVARRAAHDAREQPPHYSRGGLIKAKSPPPFVFLTRPPHARRWKPPSRLRATRRR